MQAIVETLFDIIYLTTVLTLGVRMVRRSAGRRQYRLFGWLAVVLGAGTPSTWCPGRWRCAPPDWRTIPWRWGWASGSPR